MSFVYVSYVLFSMIFGDKVEPVYWCIVMLDISVSTSVLYCVLCIVLLDVSGRISINQPSEHWLTKWCWAAATITMAQ